MATGKIDQPSISTLQTKFEKFQAKEKAGGLEKFGKTVKKFVQKKSYQTLKMQLSSRILEQKGVSNEVKKSLMLRKGQVVSAKAIIKGLQSINGPQKSAAKPPTRDAALSLPEKGDKARNNFKAKMESSQLPEDLASAHIFEKGDPKDDALKDQFDQMLGAQTLDQNKRGKSAGMFRRYGNFHKANMDTAVTFKSASFPHQLHANKVDLLGQNFICHEAVDIPEGSSTKPNAKTGLGSLLAMYSEQDISVSINLTTPRDSNTNKEKGFGIGSYVEAEGLKLGDEREIPDIAGESHTLRVLDIRRHDPNDGGLNVDMVKVSIDGKEHTHLYCKEWNDFAVISTEKMLELSHLHHEVKADASGPTAVHCSAGLGRTGVFVAVDAVSHSDSANTEYLTSEALVDDIRTQRFAAVQTAAQFKIIDTVVKNKDTLQKLMQGNDEADTNVGKATTDGSPKVVSKGRQMYAQINKHRKTGRQSIPVKGPVPPPQAPPQAPGMQPPKEGIPTEPLSANVSAQPKGAPEEEPLHANVDETTTGGSPEVTSKDRPKYAQINNQRRSGRKPKPIKGPVLPPEVPGNQPPKEGIPPKPLHANVSAQPKGAPEEPLYANVRSEPVYENLSSFSLTAAEVKSQLTDGTYANLTNGKPADMDKWLNDIGKLSSDDLSALFIKQPPTAIMRALWSDLDSGVMKMHAEKKVATFFSAAAQQGMTSQEAQRNYANVLVADHPLAQHQNGFWLQFAKDEIKNS
ncbi:MAG: protein-tyrosine phosphatase family protein [Candidatus Endonucleobacter sp. (ex Gigantidas childressi)]|nr:protein-tyrosine phosphatase family protein [Candidatus Endonucleobacter sp. (ex Gigantidas childressi)]